MKTRQNKNKKKNSDTSHASNVSTNANKRKNAKKQELSTDFEEELNLINKSKSSDDIDYFHDSADEYDDKNVKRRKIESPLPTFQTSPLAVIPSAINAQSQMQTSSIISPTQTSMQPIMPPIMQSMMHSMMQSMMQPMVQPVIQNVSQPPVEAKKVETRGRKPKTSQVAAEEACSVEVCSIKWVCEPSHPNFSLNNKIDTCALNKICGYEKTIHKADVRLSILFFISHNS
jgi:hypothetical protein